MTSHELFNPNPSIVSGTAKVAVKNHRIVIVTGVLQCIDTRSAPPPETFRPESLFRGTGCISRRLAVIGIVSAGAHVVRHAFSQTLVDAFRITSIFISYRLL